MATRKGVLTDTQSAPVDCRVTSGLDQNASEAERAGLRLPERDETELGALRARLSARLEQARQGDLAAGWREDAIRPAFAPFPDAGVMPEPWRWTRAAEASLIDKLDLWQFRTVAGPCL